jgi:hypothetical protein
MMKISRKKLGALLVLALSAAILGFVLLDKIRACSLPDFPEDQDILDNFEVIFEGRMLSLDSGTGIGLGSVRKCSASLTLLEDGKSSERITVEPGHVFEISGYLVTVHSTRSNTNFFSSAPGASNGYIKLIINKKKTLSPIPEDEKECLARGGEWKRIGLSREESCNLRTSDAGAYCTDSSQCEGACIGKDVYSTYGACSERRRVAGCHAFGTDGKVRGLLCAD